MTTQYHPVAPTAAHRLIISEPKGRGLGRRFPRARSAGEASRGFLTGAATRRCHTRPVCRPRAGAGDGCNLPAACGAVGPRPEAAPPKQSRVPRKRLGSTRVDSDRTRLRLGAESPLALRARASRWQPLLRLRPDTERGATAISAGHGDGGAASARSGAVTSRLGSLARVSRKAGTARDARRGLCPGRPGRGGVSRGDGGGGGGFRTTATARTPPAPPRTRAGGASPAPSATGLPPPRR